MKFAMRSCRKDGLGVSGSDASHDDPDKGGGAEGMDFGHGDACQGYREEHGHD